MLDISSTYNHLPRQLKNHYILARHGFSLANNDNLICSNPDIAIPSTGGPLGTGYGLHEKGKVQVKESATLLARHLFPTGSYQGNNKEPVKIFCSPFKRTMETAAIIQETLNHQVTFNKDNMVQDPTPNLQLRERWFGDFDMTSDDNYHICWQDDGLAPDHGEHSKHNVESCTAVCDRATQFIVDEIEANMEGKIVILVCHGDICQITATAFMHIEPWRQREIKHVETAEWRDTKEL
ncbi:histidine phosphatase superfamily [Halteromyces radiatus]|uniref:histidine phosphatase superfamily n=1 Tax=Halteromyces radiatus TaxID=101107 RepID=UPI00221E61D1|nr:histidine phosphatase superfamily [Halteromyces radiatus]KAI8097720.1 histidine phosphatase superfamily [Halteromyces radiatus]